MHNMMAGLLVLFSLLAVNPLSAAEHSQLKAFPSAKEGFTRFVIELPDKERGLDREFKVELIPGKMMRTDGVNQVRLGVNITARPLAGWGYTFYEVTGSGNAMSTMIGVPENSSRIKTFVQGSPLMIHYNSRLPVVIYAPEGYLIRYRIWSAGTVHSAEVK